jgi:hypothetical protein
MKGRTMRTIVCALLSHLGFQYELTGSRRLGIHQVDSDWDYVVHIDRSLDTNTLDAVMKALGFSRPDVPRGFVSSYQDIVYRYKSPGHNSESVDLILQFGIDKYGLYTEALRYLESTEGSWRETLFRMHKNKDPLLWDYLKAVARRKLAEEQCSKLQHDELLIEEIVRKQWVSS